MAREIHSVGVVGLGTMGAGIAEVVARTGVTVVGVEVDDAAIARAREHLEHSTERAVAGGKLDAGERAALLARITFTTDLTDLADVDLVMEAIPESLELKASVFTELEQVCRPDVILASNTSSLSVTEIGVHTGRPGKVVGLHFFNPAPVLKLVEIVRTVVTEPDVVADVEAFARELGKEPVVIGDRAGFIANALLFGYLNHAVSMYESRYATREDLDAAMRFGCGYPMGPLALLDLIGLDTAYEILETMYRQSRNRLHAPAPILKQMITAGLLGRKSGRGFYTYDGVDSPTVVADADTPELVAADESTRDVRAGRRRRHRHDGHRHRGSPCQERVSTSSCGRGPRTRPTLALEKVRKSLDRQVAKGRLSEEDRDGVAGPAPRCHRVRRAGRLRPRHRGRRRGTGGQAGGVRRARQGWSSRVRSSPRPRRRCRSSSALPRPRGPRTSSACTSSTRHP